MHPLVWEVHTKKDLDGNERRLKKQRTEVIEEELKLALAVQKIDHLSTNLSACAFVEKTNE